MDTNILRTQTAIANLDDARRQNPPQAVAETQLNTLLKDIFTNDVLQSAEVQAVVEATPWYCKERGFATHDRVERLGDCWDAVVGRTVTQEQANFMFFLLQEAIQENMILREKIDGMTLTFMKKHLQETNWGRYGRGA